MALEIYTSDELEMQYVTRTYNGKNGCACGCAGSYADAGTPAAIKRLAFVNKNLKIAKGDYWTDENCYEVENKDGTRVTRIYSTQILSVKENN